ncbi:MAG: alkaline phosphatase family protein [Planctomycetes bacterium]|nr:alkaline phosphatase family protein [Planctomycetota bacterium]
MKVLIIGLDGATWDVLTDDVLEQHMPSLYGLKKSGTSGVLESTIPAITAAAWPTCISGCHPKTHGLATFQQYSFKDNSYYITNSTHISVPNMWHYLGEKGLRVASINVPMTYPVYPVNGYMISGFGCPGVFCDFVYPHDFKEKLLKQIPDYEVFLNLWHFKKHNEGLGKTKVLFEENIEKVKRCFEYRLEAARLIQSESPMDVMMVQFQQIDQLQHLCWPYLSAKTRDRYPWHRDQLFNLYRHLDRIIGQLLEELDSGGLAIVVSDHGFGPNPYYININKILTDWGYIKRADAFHRMGRRVHRNLLKFQKKHHAKMTVSLKRPVDWGKTKAMVLSSSVQGILYVNVKGRQPDGCVEPGQEYDSVIRELKERLSEITNPHNHERVFKRIGTPQEIYGSPSVSCETFGDLMLVQNSNYFIRLSMKQDLPHIELRPGDSLDASGHYGNGLYVISGKGMRTNHSVQAHIGDIAPTIYTWLKMAIPAEVDGSVILEAFEAPPQVNQRSEVKYPASFRQEGSESEVSTPEEEKALTEQLKGLGYL